MKLYIASCVAGKSGVKNGRPWTRYMITDPKGIQYITFENKYIAMVGQEVDLEIKEEIYNGKTYLNIVEPRKAGAVDGASIMVELKAIRQYVKEIHGMLLEPQPADGGPTEIDLGKGDIKPSDLPF